mgnify:CR=1 FL=1
MKIPQRKYPYMQIAGCDGMVNGDYRERCLQNPELVARKEVEDTAAACVDSKGQTDYKVHTPQSSMTMHSIGPFDADLLGPGAAPSIALGIAYLSVHSLAVLSCSLRSLRKRCAMSGTRGSS